jgi:predicted metal-dependent hydrolase
VSGINVDVIRKDIKNLHIGVYPPNGRVRVAAPLIMDQGAIRLAVIQKLGWIKRQQEKFAAQPRQSQREMVSGESHYFLGRRYRLHVREHDSHPSINLRGITHLELSVQPGMSTEQRESILSGWYHEQLEELVLPILEKWQSTLSVQVAGWGIKKMKTKWGSCKASAKYIWFNLELAKKPIRCIEYIVIHELLHLLEARHSEQFTALLSLHFPNWRQCQNILNEMPLGHDVWDE